MLGDTLYGGTAAARVYLHSAQLGFRHPASGQDVLFDAPPEFSSDPRQALRSAAIERASTNAYRVIHGAADGRPGLYVDLLGDFLLAQSSTELTPEQQGWVGDLGKRLGARGRRGKPPGVAFRDAPTTVAPSWIPTAIYAGKSGLPAR